MTLPDPQHRGDRPLGAKRPKAERSRGQILIMFVMAIFVFTGMVALVIDVSWYWVNSLRIQRAADAAALAGVVQLPTNPTGAGGAYALARAEATKNGYDDLAASIVVTPLQQPAVTGRRLEVTVTAPVDMFFMRIFGISQVSATRIARAEFVLPVPMGSPDNWYGVFGDARGLTSTTTSTVPGFYQPSGSGNSGLKLPTTSPAPLPAVWTANSGTLVSAVGSQNTAYARTSVNGSVQEWGGFDLLSGLTGSQIATTVNGLQVELIDVHLSPNTACGTNTIRVALSYNGGVNWTSNVAGPLPAGNITPNLPTSTTSGDYTFGSTSSVAAWPLASPAHTWTGNDLGNTNFRLRLTANKGCATPAAQLNVDRIRVRADYGVSTWVNPVTTTTTTNLGDVPVEGPGTPCTTGVAGCYEPDGQVLSPNGFWGTMNTEGAENVNGDAYQAYYDTELSTINPEYEAEEFYNYAIEMPVGSSGGSVYVYDPGFCSTVHDKGTGDRWFSGDDGALVNSYYALYDTKGTLSDITDDGPALATSTSMFLAEKASDSTMGGTTSGSPTQCRYTTDIVYGDGRDFHNRWYRLASGLAGGKIYRVHTTTTDPNGIGDTRGTYGENSFALYTQATVGTPRIYGIGAMQAFTPLKATGPAVTSEFYLAQIDAVHAGKTVEIKLWDPGDTSPLSGTLQILVPDAGGWSPTTFDYTAARGTTHALASPCNALTGNNVTSVQTSTPSSRFNGCWLTIQIPIPSGYVADQSGWWKIRYSMTGGGTSNDVTTWKVAIKGNPVHLIVP